MTEGTARPELDLLADVVTRLAARQAIAANLPDSVGDRVSTLQAHPLAQLLAAGTTPRPVIIGGLLRQGETLNLVAAPKTGKSWLVMALALCLASGRPWLGRATTPTRTLLIDNELHPETLAHRFQGVVGALGLGLPELGDRLDILTGRGSGLALDRLDALLARHQPKTYGVVVLDAWYRFLPDGVDENSNSDVTKLYNQIDLLCATHGCAVVIVHHTSKGNQGGKGVTDVGSGAGSQSRACDTHLVLRPVQADLDGWLRMDAVTRSFPPAPLSILRREGVVWALSSEEELPDGVELTPGKRATGSPRTKPKPTSADFLRDVLTDAFDTEAVLVDRAQALGYSRSAFATFFRLAKQSSAVERKVLGNHPHQFRRRPPDRPPDLTTSTDGPSK